MKKKVEDLPVTENRRLNEEYYELVLRSGEALPAIAPGQFAELRVDHAPRTFLRRPISFYDTDPNRREIRFLIQEVGEGTRQLARLQPGDLLNVIYPLGHPFSVVPGSRFLLVAGGVGIAPMLLLGRKLREEGKTPVFLFGFRSSRQWFDLTRFEALGEVHITTEDGSLGEQGLVTGHPVIKTEHFDGYYTCGPEPMMKAVAALADGRDTFCEVSLENTMACGFGACLTCAQPTVHGMKMVCTDGPVFNTKELLW